MNNTNEDIQIYGKLVNVSTEGIVADATSVWSDRYNKNVEGAIGEVDSKVSNLDNSVTKLNTRTDQITETLKSIAATGGASVASAVTYDNATSNLVSVNVQGAIDELHGTKIDKTSILQESGTAEDKVMSQKAVSVELTKKADVDDVNSSLKELQDTVFPLQVSLSLDKTVLEFTGTDQAVNASYSVKRKDALVIPSSLVLTINGMVKEIDIKSSDTVSIDVHREGESMVVLTAKYDELVKSATAKVVMVLPIYFGFGTSQTDVAIADNKLDPCTSAVGVYEKTSTKDNVNFIILVPKTLPGLSSFTMGGSPFVMITSSVVINGKDYYMYKSGGVYMSGTTVKVQAS